MLWHLLAQHGLKFQEYGVFDRPNASVANDAAVAASSFTALSVDSSIFLTKYWSGGWTIIHDDVFYCFLPFTVGRNYANLDQRKRCIASRRPSYTFFSKSRPLSHLNQLQTSTVRSINKNKKELQLVQAPLLKIPIIKMLILVPKTV